MDVLFLLHSLWKHIISSERKEGAVGSEKNYLERGWKFWLTKENMSDGGIDGTVDIPYSEKRESWTHLVLRLSEGRTEHDWY